MSLLRSDSRRFRLGVGGQPHTGTHSFYSASANSCPLHVGAHGTPRDWAYRRPEALHCMTLGVAGGQLTSPPSGAGLRDTHERAGGAVGGGGGHLAGRRPPSVERPWTGADQPRHHRILRRIQAHGAWLPISLSLPCCPFSDPLGLLQGAYLYFSARGIGKRLLADTKCCSRRSEFGSITSCFDYQNSEALFYILGLTPKSTWRASTLSVRIAPKHGPSGLTTRCRQSTRCLFFPKRRWWRRQLRRRERVRCWRATC